MELGPFPFTVFHGTDGKHLPFLMKGACVRGVYIDELAGRIVGPVHAMDGAKQERCFFLVPSASLHLGGLSHGVSIFGCNNIGGGGICAAAVLGGLHGGCGAHDWT